MLQVMSLQHWLLLLQLWLLLHPRVAVTCFCGLSWPRFFLLLWLLPASSVLNYGRRSSAVSKHRKFVSQLSVSRVPCLWPKRQEMAIKVGWSSVLHAQVNGFGAMAWWLCSCSNCLHEHLRELLLSRIIIIWSCMIIQFCPAICIHLWVK